MLALSQVAQGRAGALASLPPCPQSFDDQELIRDGYSRIAVELRNRVAPSARAALGWHGILVNAAGCWHARVRQTSGLRERVWIEEVDPKAVRRYRRRSWVLKTGDTPPSGFRVDVTCGDQRCLNPDHLHLIQLSPSAAPTRGPGRWEWHMEVDEETGEEVESGEWVSDADQPRETTDWSTILLGKSRKPISQRAQWEASRDWQAIDTEVQPLSQQDLWSIRTQHASFAQQALRWNLSVDAVRAIRYGRYGDGLQPATKPLPLAKLPDITSAEAPPSVTILREAATLTKSVEAKSRLFLQQGLWALRKIAPAAAAAAAAPKQPASPAKDELPPEVTAEPVPPAMPKVRGRTRSQRRRAEGVRAAAALLTKEPKPEKVPGPGTGHGAKARGEASGSARVTEADVRAIRASEEGLKALGRRYGMSPQAIHKIRSGKSWAHVV